jgi:predicted amidohydrolase YtcJ
VVRWLGVCWLAGCAARVEPASLIVQGRLVDAAGERRGAVVVRGEQIVQVDTIAASRRWRGPETVVQAAPIVTAGFVDAHGHPGWLAETRAQVDLRGAASYAEALHRLGAAVGEGVLRGFGWDQEDWADLPAGGWPLAADLVVATGGRSAVLTRVDGHAAWVTPDQLAAVPSVDPPGGAVVRDGQGEPTGVLIDAAMVWSSAEQGVEERARALEGALAGLRALGLTGAHAMSVSDAELAALTLLDAQGRLPMRVWAFVQPESDAAARLLREGPWRGDRLAVLGLKTFVDGALGSRGAWLHEDYADQPGHRGSPQTDLAALSALATACLQVGASLAVHAIGDAGVDVVIEAFAAAREAAPGSLGLLRVEHAQVLSASALGRLSAPGVVVSMQPVHAVSDAAWAQDRLGAERLNRAYAWRSVREAGATLAFGSDFPVESADPAEGLWAAGHGPQRLDEAAAVQAFTGGAAAAVGEQARLGALRAGALADLSLWRRGPEGRWQSVGVVLAGLPAPTTPLARPR